MAAQFTTGSPEMLAAVSSMEQANRALQGNIKNLQSEVEGVSGAWGGAAATAFTTLMGKFGEDAAKLNKDLQQIADAVRSNNTTYQAQEDQAQSSMSQILGGLG